MPKYRQLTSQELQGLKQEFIKYLIVNGIDADEWTKIQSTDSAKASEISDLFSDVVFEKVLRQAQYLRHTTKDSVHCFHYQSDAAVMIGLKSTTGSLSLDVNITNMLKSGAYELITGTKSYTKQREIELFEMTLKGAEMSDGELYKQLGLLM